jgi:hypothetical protein
MKKTISTKSVTSTLLDGAKSKLDMAIKLAAMTRNFLEAWKVMQDAKQELFHLETIFYCEREYAMINEIKDIYTILENSINTDEICQVSKECYAKIIELENFIAEELEQAE